MIRSVGSANGGYTANGSGRKEVAHRKVGRGVRQKRLLFEGFC